MGRLFAVFGVFALLFARLLNVARAIGWRAFLVYLGVFAISAAFWTAIVSVSVVYKMTTGWLPAGYVAVFAGAILAAVALLPFLWARSVRVALFIHFMGGFALLATPWHNALEYLPLFLMAVLAYLIGASLTGMRLGGMRFWTGLALVLVFVTAIPFFLPRFAAAVRAGFPRIEEGLVGMVEGRAPALSVTLPPSPAAGDIERREIPLEPPGAWVAVAPLPPWRVKVDQRHVRGELVIRYNDGREVTAGPETKLTLPRTLYPVALKGEGIALLWLCPPPSRACE